MDKNGWSSLSVERFAAYLDGNLSPEEMNEMEMLIAGSPEMEDLVRLSDSIDEQMQRFEFEGVEGTAPEAFLETDDFDIPDLGALKDPGRLATVAIEDHAPGNEPSSGDPNGSDGFDGEDCVADPETSQTEDSGESNFGDSPDASPEDGFHQGEDFSGEF